MSSPPVPAYPPAAVARDWPAAPPVGYLDIETRRVALAACLKLVTDLGNDRECFAAFSLGGFESATRAELADARARETLRREQAHG